MQPLKTKIQDWKTRLIDLTKRNKLLNFKETKLSTVKLQQPDIFSVFSSLAEGNFEQKLVFEGDVAELKKNEILAETLSEKHHKTLHQLLSKSRGSLEEQGINILFCTFGLCKWTDPKEPDKEFYAPLVLIPIQLKRLTLTGPYMMTRFEEDMVINPAFVQQLKEMGLNMHLIENISLNEIEAESDTENQEEASVLKSFFNRFQEQINIQKDWEILEESYIGLFNYHKFVMYKDIENNSDMIEENRFLQAIATGAYPREEGDVEEPLNIDDLELDRQYQILDADASQQEAIERVKRGKDMIIQGPPGTGKSQTIVNIISEAIANDKKVLFVSEKQAALNVVKRRLDEHQLGPFCLELHSKKASKDMVYQQFDEVLKLHGVDDRTTEAFDFEQLGEIKASLNETIERFNHPYGNLEITPRQLFEALIELSPIENLNMQWDDFLKIDRELFKQIEEALKKLDETDQRHFPYLEDASKFRFRGFERLSKENFRSLLEKVKEVNDALINLSDDCRLRQWTSEKKTITENLKNNLSSVDSLSVHIDRKTLAKLIPLEDPSGFFSTNDAPLLSQYNEILNSLKESANGFLEALGKLSHLTDSPTLTEAPVLEDLEELCTFLSQVSIELFNLDLKDLSSLWNDRYTSFFGRLFGGFRKHSALIKGFFRNSDDGNEEDIKNLLFRARKIRKLFDTRKFFSDHEISETVHELSSKLTAFKTTLSSLKQINSKLTSITEGQRVPVVMNHPANNDILCETLYDWYEAINDSYTHLLELFTQSSQYYEWEDFDGKRPVDCFQLDGRLRSLFYILDHLMEIEALENKLAHLRDLGLASFITAVIQSDIEPKDYFKAFKKALYRKYIEHVYTETESLYFFKSQNYAQKKALFKQLDVEQLKYNMMRIAKKRIDLNPKYDFFRQCNSDLSKLKREIMKKRWKMPIRKLFAAIPRLVQLLKPCMLMSPLSVSHFLDSSKIQFDLVIFDEASQVLPEDAIGSIMRAKQVVVVGDNKQLPPTTFFKNTDYDIDTFENDEDYYAVNLESILDEAMVIGIEHKSLLWHYRSRNESLIHFSNQHFYDNQLVTFPSNNFHDHNYGVYLEYLEDGVYDRGKTRTNPGEVERITELILDFANNNPEKSLGVVTFNEAQKDAIIESVEKARLNDKSCEAFFGEDREEPFFVKNLESVQGDERDVIMFSIGYGKDEAGKMYYNFGPLNREGGERRLNVAVTRAKEKVLVVSSITYRDIPPEKRHGLKYLREYLLFAEYTGGKLAYEHKETVNLSAFEEDIKNELEEFGYYVDLHVGCSKYKVDVAVKSEKESGKYILGIECSPSKEDKAKTVRDRERIRETVLENLDWKIMHVWIKEWYENKEKVIDEIIQTIESEYEKNDTVAPSTENTEDPEAFFIEKTDGQKKTDLFANYEKYSLEEFITDINSINPTLKKVLEKILEKEAPIVFSELFRGLNQCYEQMLISMDHQPNIFEGYLTEKGNLSRSAIIKLIEDMEKNVLFENDFIIVKNKPLQPRKRDCNCLIDIDHIYPLEREAMMKNIIQNAAFINSQDLIFETTRHLGYSRTGEKIKAVLLEDINRLLEKGEIVQKNGKLSFDF